MNRIHPHGVNLNSSFKSTTHLLKVSLGIIFFLCFNNIAKMVYQTQLPSILLINFLHPNKFDAILEEFEDLLLVET
nr:hypothetical protein Iba_chr04bCG5900 [Ipomoea batatas]GMC83935.1 hypothetical protein Iba_chr04cCG6850 [Ipomoea batatas]GMC88274.1 hypothetical protein Iba_chr04eCG8530 [Ipomoea batatas]GME17378.1 hypothetical protein Iba_scaffold18651CG0010 [Ipomoea batatas]